ncbi:MAG TPA: hypothetical protein VFA34_05440 [Actinomycetota bacterium]|nr:hypothetical protein [Actinomycetota bacterium]
MPKEPVYLEVGKKRVFACAVEWPGGARSGKDEREALDVLASYAKRYKRALGRRASGLSVSAASDLRVVERLPGGSGTDFGMPGELPKADRRPLRAAELKQMTQILEVCWKRFDSVVRANKGAELRKGPRGGGRDLDKIVAHVLEAEVAYLNALGGKFKASGPDPAPLRAAIIEALGGQDSRRASREGSERRTEMADAVLRPPLGVARARPPVGDRGSIDVTRVIACKASSTGSASLRRRRRSCGSR